MMTTMPFHSFSLGGPGSPANTVVDVARLDIRKKTVTKIEIKILFILFFLCLFFPVYYIQTHCNLKVVIKKSLTSFVAFFDASRSYLLVPPLVTHDLSNINIGPALFRLVPFL